MKYTITWVMVNVFFIGIQRTSVSTSSTIETFNRIEAQSLFNNRMKERLISREIKEHSEYKKQDYRFIEQVRIDSAKAF